jgi:hypothetical protein
MVHPLNSFCGEDCLLGALVIAISFSLLNIQIYNFFIGQPFYVALPISPVIKSLSDCKNNKEKMSRIFYTVFNMFINIVIIILAIKLSWLFN